MAIRPSPSRDLPRLIVELSSGDALRRESAAARLIIMGSPAMTRLSELASAVAADTEGRRAALRALAAIDPGRATRVALSVVDTSDEAVALDAIDVLSVAAPGSDALSTGAFERLTEVALDTARPVSRRIAALAALGPLPDRLMNPIYDALARDPAPEVAARIAHRAQGPANSVEEPSAKAIGPNSRLETVAVAWLAAAVGSRRRRELSALFTTIVEREGMTRQHSVLTAILAKFPAAAVLVASAPKTARRRPRAAR